MTIQSRLKSKPFWFAIVAIVMFVLGNWGLYDAIGLTAESFQKFVDLIFVAVAALGVFNNPSSKDTW